MYRTTEQWIEVYQKKDALWFHDGNEKRPHALLSSGKHSDGFFNSGIVTEDPTELDMACHDLVELLIANGLFFGSVDRVVGPAMGAITMAHDIARHISSQRKGHDCLCAYTEKDEMMDGSKKMVFKRATIKPGENILLVEDVLTTGGSVDLTASAVLGAEALVMPYVAVLVNRSGLTNVGGKRIVALIDKHLPIWEPSECPLCKAGSEAIKPKAMDNWERLNAVYS